jgi:CRISPR-associated protein Cmr2
MNDYMLMFTLGPVQPFIMQARKTRDLWLGSRLLSELMAIAITDIKEHIIFPTVQEPENRTGIPNKYVALFDSIKEASGAAERSIEQIRDFWEKAHGAVWGRIITDRFEDVTWQIWQRQVNFDTLFEIYWAIVSREEDHRYKDYGAWLEATEGLLAARKRLRDFKPQNEPGEKSAISGEREILHGTRTDPEGLRIFWQAIARRHSANDIDQQGDERLDAMDMIKRFAVQAGAIPTKGTFPSTSSIAVASFIEKLLDSDHEHEAFSNWNNATEGSLATKSQEATQDIYYLAQHARQEWQWILRCDGDLYFPATFTPRRLEKDYRIINSVDVIKTSRRALGRLFAATDELHITRPTPYYAVIQMDGDNMGMLLSSTRDVQEHQAISAALSQFARDVAHKLVEQQYPARLVYAGGDDLLAFAPLARDATSFNQGQPLSILELVHELQSRYQEHVRASLLPAQTAQDREREATITVRMGIAIAHHLTSLSYVLRSAREAEDAAKRRYGRNALVVTVLRRSGEQTQVGCHWHYPGLENDGQPIKLFSRFLALFKSDTLSPKCVYVLLEEAPALVGLGETSACESEVRRVLLRHLDLAQKADEEKQALKAEVAMLARRVVQLAQQMDTKHEDELGNVKDDVQEPPAVDLHSVRRRFGIVEVFGWLLVMAFLARKDQGQE